MITAHTTTSRLQQQLPGYNSNFQATKTIWIACMHACVRVHTHTHSVLYKYTKTKPFIHHLPLSHIHTHPHTHSQLYKCTDTKSFIPSLPHTHLQLHTEMLFFSHTYIYTLRCPPPPPTTHTDSLSLNVQPPPPPTTHTNRYSLNVHSYTDSIHNSMPTDIAHSKQPTMAQNTFCFHLICQQQLAVAPRLSNAAPQPISSGRKTSMFTCRSPVGCFLSSKHQCSHAGLLWVAFSLQNINVHMQVSCGLLSPFKTSMFTCRSPVGCFLPSKHQCSHAGLLWVAFSLPVSSYTATYSGEKKLLMTYFSFFSPLYQCMTMYIKIIFKQLSI